jgi:hypothetical protein
LCGPITRNETGRFLCEPEGRRNKRHPRDPKNSQIETTNEGNAHHFLVHFQFIPQGQTVNETYVEILKWLREAVLREVPELWHTDWLLLHDIAAAHKALCVEQFLTQKSITETHHKQFAPDLAPNDIGFFQSLP